MQLSMGKKRPVEASHPISDPRFAQIHTDPRFRTAPAHIQQLSADDRFSSMFSDAAFQGPRPPKVDARGKAVKGEKNDLKKLYGRKEGGCLDEEGKFRWEEVSSSEEAEGEKAAEQGAVDEDLWEEQEKPPVGDSSHRFAVLNLDWTGITAIDLLALFRSFCPKDGSVLSVSIYPSEFGQQRLNHETAQGPDTAIFSQTQESGLDEVKLRKYERERMKYYYAVADCDSVATAEAVYQSCEGLEIERTSNMMDLRFVPDSLVEFPYAAKEVATSVPAAYSLKEFFTRALQHSTVKLTWDETPLDRTQTLKKAFTEEDMEKMDLAEYLAPVSSSDEDEKPPQNSESEASDSDFASHSQFSRMKKDDIDLEITFNTAFDDLSAKQPTPVDESAWEKHEREHSERKKPEKKTFSQKIKEKRKAKLLSKQEKATLSLLVNDSEGTKYTFDPEDPRFGPVFNDPKYAVDPTNPLFLRDSEANKEVLQVQRKKRKLAET